MESNNNFPVEVYVCPHWSDSTKSCLSSKQGLYLPVPEHILTYCKTSNHSFCPQFEQQSTDLPEYKNGSEKVADRRERTSADRRKYTRISGSYPFRIAGLQEDSNTASLLDTKVTTVNLSAGGMRLQIPCDLPVNSMVSFSLNGSSGPPIQGIGQIKWCRSFEDSPVYHAGIVFTDNVSSGVVSCYLGNPLS
jgi:hypothetical protein